MLRFTQMTLKLGIMKLLATATRVLLDPKIWNHQPSNIQSETSLIKFQEYINTWFGLKCK